jgi:hypothetical protein
MISVWQRLLVVECRVPNNYIRRMVGLMQASSSVSLFFFGRSNTGRVSFYVMDDP